MQICRCHHNRNLSKAGIALSVSGASRILLINPPVAKPSEPPAGIARLAGLLRDNNIDCRVLDLSLDCLVAEFDQDVGSQDRWSRRAYKNRYDNLQRIRSPSLYQSHDRYQRVVNDLSRLLSMSGRRTGSELSFANFVDYKWSPLASSDLLACAEQFETNHFYRHFGSLLRTTLEDYQPDYVGLSLSYLSQALSGFAVAGFIQRHYPNLKIVAGGGLLTSWMSSSSWNDPFRGLFDSCIAGPGEEPLLKLFGKEGGSVLGTFSYDGFTMGRYLAPGVVLPYAASYGCYWKKCQFCPDFAEGSCYAALPVSAVLTEIEELVKRYDPVLVHLLDNAVSPALLKALTRSPISVPWYGFARFERDLADLEFCRALKRAGCVMLKLGLESGSQRVLDQLNKGIDLQRAEIILDNLKKSGIAAYVYLLFGTPAESEEDALLTLDFVRRHHQAITFFNLAIFNMPVCSPEALHLKNRFSDGDLSLYCDFIHPDGWDRKKVRNFLQKRFRKDALIREIDQRNPGPFSSNHAPLLIK